MIALEIAVQDATGARVAADAGADRVELCAALGATGGVTPSAAMIEAVVAVGLPAHVLIRCRPGPFVYDTDELAVMCRDAQRAVRQGAAGVVVGALTTDRRLDLPAMARLRDAAKDANPVAEVTCHRAIDVVIGAGGGLVAVDDLINLGTTRVLTSGGASRALDGADALAQLARRAAGRLQVMAGGGVRLGDIAALAATGIDAVHLSARAFQRADDGTGPGGGPGDVEITSAEIVRAAAQAVRAVTARAAPAG